MLEKPENHNMSVDERLREALGRYADSITVGDQIRELAARGLAVVPVEPTAEMLWAGQRCMFPPQTYDRIYKAMIGAVHKNQPELSTGETGCIEND